MISWELGDCRELIKKVPKIDLICTDPPFNFSTHGQGMMRRRDYLTEVKNGFGSDFKPLEYLDLFYERMELFNAYFFCNKTLIPIYINWATEKDLSWDVLTWIKPNPTPLKNNHYLPDTEYIIYIKANGAYFNSSLRFDYYRKWILEDSPNQHKANYNHPAAKPISVMKKLILISNPPDGVVVDPFLGSGATLAACKELSVTGIGFEINPQYVPVIERRCSHTTYFAEVQQ